MKSPVYSTGSGKRRSNLYKSKKTKKQMKSRVRGKMGKQSKKTNYKFTKK